MQFLLDHNVLGSVYSFLEERGHDAEWSRNLVGQEAEDQVVATAAMEASRILVSHDNDMKRVQKFLSDKQRSRFPRLSRLILQCDQATSLNRLRLFISMIEFEFEVTQIKNLPFLFHLQEHRAVICR